MDLTGVVERMKSMEQRLGVAIQGVYAELEDGYLTVNFELLVDGGGHLAQDIEIVAGAYDAAGRVVATGSNYFSAEKVFGLVVGSICVSLNSKQVGRIRLYPQKD